MRNLGQIVVIGLVLAAHVLGDWALVAGGWTVSGGWDLFALAWPMSRCSLIALWAALSQTRSYVRFPAAVVATAWAWYVLVPVISAQMQGERSAGWATLFATQALIVLMATSAGCLAWRWNRLRRDAANERTLMGQYSLGFLLLWTTLLAILLGVGRTVCIQLGWTPEVVQWQYFYYCPLLGAFNAVFALLVFASLLGRVWILARILLAVTLIGAVAYFETDAFLFFFGEAGGIEPADFLFLAGFQAAYLYATLVPLRLCGCFGRQRGTGVSPVPSVGL